MATGAFERLRRAWPNAHIAVGARPHMFSLLSGSDWFDEQLPTPKARGIRGLWRQVREVRDRRFDLAIVLPNSQETGLVPLLARVPHRLGYRQGRPGMMTLGLHVPRSRPLFGRRDGPRRVPEPMPGYYAKLLDQLGIPAGREGTILHVTDAERSEIDAWLRQRGLADGRRLVLLTAGAAYGASKLWGLDKFAAVGRALQERGDAAIVLAGPAEVDMAEEVARNAGCVAATDPILPLGGLKALVERSTAMVTTDTGPRHLSVALGKPTVCVIGPTDTRYTNYALDRTALVKKDLDCMPCQRKVCPLGHHDCMRTIEVDEVMTALDGLLARESVA